MAVEDTKAGATPPLEVETGATSPVETSAAAPATVETPPHPAEVPTLLEGLKAPGAEPPKEKVEAKPAEAPKAEEKSAEAKPEEKPAAEAPKAEEPKAEEPAPVDWDKHEFTFAETVKPDAEKVGAFKALAREANIKPEAAQKFVDMFNEAATSFADAQARNQIQVWNDTRSNWRKEVLAHPVLGGNGHNHAMGVVARARDLATSLISNAQPGTPKYQDAASRIENFVRVTGAGDHPVFLEILHALGGALDEPRAPTAVPSPPKNNGVRPSNSLYAPKRQ